MGADSATRRGRCAGRWAAGLRGLLVRGLGPGPWASWDTGNTGDDDDDYRLSIYHRIAFSCHVSPVGWALLSSVGVDRTGLSKVTMPVPGSVASAFGPGRRGQAGPPRGCL